MTAGRHVSIHSRKRGRVTPLGSSNDGTVAISGGLTVTGVNLCVDFNSAVGRNHVFRDRNALVDGDALVDDCVVLHAAHL